MKSAASSPLGTRANDSRAGVPTPVKTCVVLAGEAYGEKFASESAIGYMRGLTVEQLRQSVAAETEYELTRRRSIPEPVAGSAFAKREEPDQSTVFAHVLIDQVESHRALKLTLWLSTPHEQRDVQLLTADEKELLGGSMAVFARSVVEVLGHASHRQLRKKEGRRSRRGRQS